MTFVLVAATGLALYACYRLAQPLAPALAWGMALAVVSYPLHRWIYHRAPRATLAATVAVAVVALAVVAPMVFVTQAIVQQGSAVLDEAKDTVEQGRWQAALERNPRLAPFMRWVRERLGVGDLFERIIGIAQDKAPAVITGSAWLLLQLLVTFLVLFYLLRDRESAVRALRSLVPLSDTETDTVFRRITDTIEATIFGSLTVAAIQGLLGGLMFWWLGLPAPALWGFVMALLAVIPMLGTFVIWAPTAVFLALEGHWTKALLLTAWGAAAIGLIDNLLYPLLVGSRLRLHPLPVFVSLVGGLSVFGAAGVILGPITLAVTAALVDIWRRRTAYGQTADPPVPATTLQRAPNPEETGDRALAHRSSRAPRDRMDLAAPVSEEDGSHVDPAWNR